MLVRGALQPSSSWRPHWRISDAPIAVLDVETTGLFPDRDQRIWEIALIDRGGERFFESQDPTTGLGEDEPELLSELFSLMEGLVILGHNVLFDLNFLAHRAERNDLRMPVLGFVDTLHIARRLEPGLDGYRLHDIAEHLNLEARPTHRALQDAKVCEEIFQLLVSNHHLVTLEDVGVRRFGHVGSWGAS